MSFLDMSDSGHTFTAEGNILPTISTSIKKFGTGAVDFTDGNLKSEVTTDFNFGSNDYTIDFWIYIKDPSGGTAYGTVLKYYDENVSNSEIFRVYYSSSVSSFSVGHRFDTGGNAGWASLSLSYDISSHYDEWIHVAITKTGTIFRGWINGDNVRSSAVSDLYSTITGDARLTIGSDEDVSSSWTCEAYVDELRIDNGTAHWNTDDNFTPPTEAYV